MVLFPGRFTKLASFACPSYLVNYPGYIMDTNTIDLVYILPVHMLYVFVSVPCFMSFMSVTMPCLLLLGEVYNIVILMEVSTRTGPQPGGHSILYI